MWAMIAAPAAIRVSGVVEIHIWLGTSHPPTGRVTIEGEPAQPFMGWLQLLTILANALQPPPAPPSHPRASPHHEVEER